MEGCVSRKTRPNPDRLPDGHFIEWLAEAKQRYQYELPPFVEMNQGSSRAGLRKNVTLRMTHDQQQDLPVAAEMICWSWSPQYTFFTIDSQGQRLIVKGDSSDRYCSYKSWLGTEKGFSLYPVAFGPWQKDLQVFKGPNLDLKTHHENHVQMLSVTPWLGSSATPDGRIQQTSMKNWYSAQPDWQLPKLSPTYALKPSSARPTTWIQENVAGQRYTQEQPHDIETGHTAQAASPSIQDSPRPRQAKRRDVQNSSPTVHYDSQHYVRTPVERPTLSGPRQDISPPKGREERFPTGSYSLVRASPVQGLPELSPKTQEEDRGLTSKPNEDSAIGTRRQNYALAERANERVIKRQPCGNSTGAPIAHGPQYPEQNYIEANSLVRPTKRRRQSSTPNPLNPTSPQLSTEKHSPSTRSSPHPTPSTSSQDPSRFSSPTTSLNPPQSTTAASSPLRPLTPHKQSRTTLFIAIPLSTDTVPLKLRSCMTLSSFFASVLAICAQPDHGDVVSGIRATFDWKRDGDVDRAILLKQDLEDTFEVFLEIVDGAPCWVIEGGRCGVAVEVVLV